MAFVFHVEFGINETELTVLLENKQYSEAEKTIRDNAVPSYLDEGCYQRTPLFIVLNGKDQIGHNKTPKNLYLAKLLVEFGACVNYRVPITDGAEYVSPGSSPLELAVEYFISISNQQHYRNLNPTSTSGKNTDISQPTLGDLEEDVIGVNNKSLRSLADVKDHLLDLIFIMLSNGGDTNIRDENGQGLLHRAVLQSQDDLRLIELLIESNVDLNAVDIKGNTPLIALCDIPMDSASRVFPETQNKILQYLLSQEILMIDKQSKIGRTAVFNCMLRGNTAGAKLLLNNGADPTKCGRIRSVDDEMDTGIKYMSPLFAAICSPLGIQQSKSPKTQLMQRISPLVDGGYFNVADISQELFCIIDEEFPSYEHLKVFGDKLINLMFGKMSTSLKQLCVRAIFQSYFQNLSLEKQTFLGIEQIMNSLEIPLNFTEDVHLRLIYWTEVITTNVLEKLIAKISLPTDSLVYFEIQLFTQQLCSKLNLFRYPDQDYDEDLHEWFSDSEDLTSSEEGESDIEYW